MNQFDAYGLPIGEWDGVFRITNRYYKGVFGGMQKNRSVKGYTGYVEAKDEDDDTDAFFLNDKERINPIRLYKFNGRIVGFYEAVEYKESVHVTRKRYFTINFK